MRVPDPTPRHEAGPDSVVVPRGARRPTAPLCRWLVGLAAAIGLLGVFGITGSSGILSSQSDQLLSAEEAWQVREIVGRGRWIRGDEFVVELPAMRAQQVAAPPYPLVNLNMGLGHLQRNPFEYPVADWGVLFRPLTWPLFFGSRWAHGLRWFARAALVLLGVAAWLSVLAARNGADAAETARRANIAALGALAIFFSSAVQWFFGHAIVDELAFAGLASFAIHRSFTASSPGRAGWWLLMGGWLAACGFFHFYAPLWAPVLWLLCAAIFDAAWKSSARPRALRRTLAGIAVVAAGVTLALAYYTPYLEVIRNTLYPGRRVSAAGEVDWARLLDLFWPSLHESAPLTATWPGYFGKVPWLNVCETSAVEATPLFLLAALALVNGRVRRALGRVASGAPATVMAWVVLGSWCLIKLPSFAGDVLLLRWTPGPRAFFVFGALTAALATLALCEMERRDGPDWQGAGWRRYLEGGVAATFLAAAFVLARRELAGGGRTGWGPIALCAALLLLGVLSLRQVWAPRLLAAAWLVPLVLATAAVNPLAQTRSLFREGVGHRVVREALRETPGRILDYNTHAGSSLSAFGWPVLASVEIAPDVDFFRFLEPDSPGFTEEIYNRYAHVYFVLPPERVFGAGDAFRAPISPCSRRLAAVGVNHFLADHDAALPAACASEFRVRSAGRAQLWTRRDAVGAVGAARGAPASALDFDWSADGAGRLVGLRPERERLWVDLPAGQGMSFALPVNRSLVDEVVCRGAAARALDAHMVFAAGPTPARCEVRFLATRGAVRRLLRPDAPRTIFRSEPQEG